MTTIGLIVGIVLIILGGIVVYDQLHNAQVDKSFIWFGYLNIAAGIFLIGGIVYGYLETIPKL